MTETVAAPSLSIEPGFPAVARPVGGTAGPTPSLAALDDAEREAVRETVASAGALHFRGFGIDTLDAFEEAARGLLGELAPYRGGDAPRHAERGRVYNASGPDRTRAVRAHNELSYAPWYPTTLCFGCSVLAEEGGATTVFDGRRVYEMLPPDVRDAFRTRGVTYIQHLPHAPGDPSGIKSWRETFETDSMEDVMALCHRDYTSATWTPLGLLTTNRTPATLQLGPDTHAWFNQSHIWRKDPSVTPDVTDLELWETRVGYGATFGDGTEIPSAYMDVVAKTLDACEAPVRWEAGDLLLVDNRAAMHGRQPYSGERQVFVAFA